MDYTNIILLAAKKAGISGVLMLAICSHESGLKNTYVPHDGGSPTYGLCQIKLETAKMYGFDKKKENLMNPATNAKYSSIYLQYQLNRYDGSWMKATSAYNAGSYNPSYKVIGCPRNLRYLKLVRKKLKKPYDVMLMCGNIKDRQEYKK